VSVQGSWICHAPQTPGDPARLQTTARLDPALSGQVTALFARHARETLPHLAGAALPLWQYVCPAGAGPVLLTRATMPSRAGQPVPVVWGLVLPEEFLVSRGFALLPCAGLFPADAAEASWPAPVDLVQLPAAAQPSETAQRLAAACLEHGPLRAPPPDALPALELLCQIVELLPPADRRQISFSTAPLGMRRVELDPGMSRSEEPAASADMRARLRLWQLLAGLLELAGSGVSLRQDPGRWPETGLAGPDLPARARQSLQLVAEDEHLGSRVREAALSWLRRTLEHRLTELAGSREVGATLDELCRAGLLSRPELFPPLWPVRVAMKLRTLSSLPADTLAQILRPEALTMLLDGLRLGPVGVATLDLIAALAHASAAVNRGLINTDYGQALARLCAQPQRLESDDELAAALALLALHFNGKTEV
jgi:hypothetical protein